MKVLVILTLAVAIAALVIALSVIKRLSNLEYSLRSDINHLETRINGLAEWMKQHEGKDRHERQMKERIGHLSCSQKDMDWFQYWHPF